MPSYSNSFTMLVFGTNEQRDHSFEQMLSPEGGISVVTCYRAYLTFVAFDLLCTVGTVG